MSKVYESEAGNTVYRNDDGGFSGYLNDDSDTEVKFTNSPAAIKWADETTEESLAKDKLHAKFNDLEPDFTDLTYMMGILIERVPQDIEHALGKLEKLRERR